MKEKMLNLYPKFGYINARTKGMKAKLFSEERIAQLLAVKTIDEVIEILEEGPYRNKVVEMSTRYSGIELVNRALNASFVDTLRKIATFIPQGKREKTSKLYALALEEWIIQDYKILIAAKATGSQIDAGQFMFLPQQQPLLFEAISAEDVGLEKAIRKLAALGQQEVFHEILRKYFRSGGGPTDYRELFKEIDNYYYNKVGKIASVERDTAIAKLLQARIGFLNIMMTLRLKVGGASQEEIEKNALGHRRGISMVRRLLENGTIEEMVREVVTHYKLAPEISEEFIKTHSLVGIEIALERKLMQKVMRTATVNALSFAVVLAYIYLKFQETVTIKSIAYSTVEGIRDEMKKILIPAR